MKPEQAKKIAQEEANKHKFETINTTVILELTGKEKSTAVKKPVKIVWVCMPKEQAFLDPSEGDKDGIREHAMRTIQTIYEFEHKHEDKAFSDYEKDCKKRDKMFGLNQTLKDE